MNRTIETQLEKMDDTAKAQLAAAILNEIDPTGDNLKMFFLNLSDTTHGELVSRAADEEQR